MAKIIIDPGKNRTKALFVTDTYDLKPLIFPSISDKVVSFSDYADSAGENQFKIQTKIKDKVLKYVVGEGIRKEFDFNASKNTTHHLMCILAAMHQLMERYAPTDNEVDLIIGCPSSDFKNEQFLKSYKNMIPKEIDLTVNGKSRHFKITSVHVYTEGMTAVTRMSCKKNYPNTKYFVCLDIGGYNINVRIYDVKGNVSNSFSLDESGINKLVSILRDRLGEVVDKRKYDISAIDYEESLILGTIPNISDSDMGEFSSTGEFINLYVDKFIEDYIIGKLMSKHNIAANGFLTIFSGGGSACLQSYIRPYMKNNSANIVFSKNFTWENCISYLTKYMSEVSKTSMKPAEYVSALQKIINCNLPEGIK